MEEAGKERDMAVAVVVEDDGPTTKVAQMLFNFST
jgi:hypothetical protein